MADREALRQAIVAVLAKDARATSDVMYAEDDADVLLDGPLAPLLEVVEAAAAHRQSIRPASEAEDAWFADFISAEKRIAATKAHQLFHQTRADLFDALDRVESPT